MTLTENRRQAHSWERAALDELRAGDVTAGVDAYAAAGRITTYPDGEAQRDALVRAWWDASRTGDPAQTVLLAHRRDHVTDLNHRARQLLRTEGLLGGPVVYGADEQDNPRCFATGDLVVVRRNDHRHGLVNGQRGRVTAVDPPTGGLQIDVGGQRRTLTRAHLLAGVLDHGYALTVHQAQGLTVDRAFLLGDTGLYREAGYVGLSRARHRSELHLSDARDDLAHTEDDIDRPSAPPEHIAALQAITRALQRSKAQRAAHDLTR